MLRAGLRSAGGPSPRLAVLLNEVRGWAKGTLPTYQDRKGFFESIVNGEPDPVGRHLLALARGPEGYARLSTVLAEAHLAGGEKGKPVEQGFEFNSGKNPRFLSIPEIVEFNRLAQA